MTKLAHTAEFMTECTESFYRSKTKAELDCAISQGVPEGCCKVFIEYERFDLAVELLSEAGYAHVTDDTPEDSYPRCGFTEDYDTTYSHQRVIFEIWWK